MKICVLYKLYLFFSVALGQGLVLATVAGVDLGIGAAVDHDPIPIPGLDPVPSLPAGGEAVVGLVPVKTLRLADPDPGPAPAAGPLVMRETTDERGTTVNTHTAGPEAIPLVLVPRLQTRMGALCLVVNSRR